MTSSKTPVKIDNRKPAHSQKAQSLKMKRGGGGKGGWGNPMDDYKYIDMITRISNDPKLTNYEEHIPSLAEVQADDELLQDMEQQMQGTFEEDYSPMFPNFHSDVEVMFVFTHTHSISINFNKKYEQSLSAFKKKIDKLVNEYFDDKSKIIFVQHLNKSHQQKHFFNQIPKILLWNVIEMKKQELFPCTRDLICYIRSQNIISKAQLESGFRRLFHRLSELTILNSNAFLILVDFGEFCVAQNLIENEFLDALKKQTEFAKDTERVARLKNHIRGIIMEYFISGDIQEGIRSISEMDTPFYTHEVVKRIISMAFDRQNRERELASQFLLYSVGDGDQFCISRDAVQLGFSILLQRVEDYYNDVPDILELLSNFILRAISDEVLPPAFLDNIQLLQTDMGYTVIDHVRQLVNTQSTLDFINIWGTNSSKSITEIKHAIKLIIKEYLTSRELDEALSAIKELNVCNFHHEIIKQLVPAVADYYIPQDIQQITEVNNKRDNECMQNIVSKLNLNASVLKSKAVQIQLAIDLLKTAVKHNIINCDQIQSGFNRLRIRMSDMKLDSPLIEQHFNIIVNAMKDTLAMASKNRTPMAGIYIDSNNVYGSVITAPKSRIIDDMVNDACTSVRKEVEKRGVEKNIVFTEFSPIECKSQTVAGLHLFVKIRVNENVIIHVNIWHKLDDSLSLTGIQFNKLVTDELLYIHQRSESESKCSGECAIVPKMVGKTKEAVVNDDIREMCLRLKEDIEVQASTENIQMNVFEVVQCLQQTVAGINFFVKIKVNCESFIHVRIWRKLDDTIQLTGIQFNKKVGELLQYF